MTSRFSPPMVPAGFFAIVLGMAGLGSAWRQAHHVWGFPRLVGEIIMAMAALVWAVLLALYVAKWVVARSQAVEETLHPVQCCFVGLIGVATMLIAGAALPYSRVAAGFLLVPGALFTLGFGLWRTGLLWRGEREDATTTAVLYLPTVAGSFVAATILSAFGLADWGQLAFGAGAFSWLAIESVLLRRLYNGPILPPALRPTLGIQLAPPTVGAVAYLSVTQGPPDILAHAMLGYGLLQTLLLLRVFGWIAEQPFASSYWGFSFGVTALSTAPLIMLSRGDSGAVATLAPYLFALANGAVAFLFFGTLWLALMGRLIPRMALAAK
jgi:tellurite resistance protein